MFEKSSASSYEDGQSSKTVKKDCRAEFDDPGRQTGTRRYD